MSVNLLTESGVLDTGIFYKGYYHKEFTIKPARVKDSIEAEKATSGRSGIEFMVALLARQIVTLGSIPKDEITVDLLGEMDDDDLVKFEAAKERLKKKKLEQSRQEVKSDD